MTPTLAALCVQVDEAQSFFLLQKEEGGQSLLDRMALQDMRR